MSKNPTILITGAGGFLGTTLVEYFTAKNWQVVGLVRGAKDRPAQKNVRYAEYDLAKPFAADICKGVDFVVHAAYVKFDRKNPDAMDVNVQGAKRLLAAARKYKVKKTVFVSSMSAHDEAVSVYGRQKLAIEKLFNGPHDAVLRCGLIVGDGGIVKQMAGFLKTKRVVPLVDGGRQPLQIIAVANLVQVIERVLIKDLSGLFTVANPKVYEYKELYMAIGNALGVKLIFVPVPFVALLAVMRAISLLRLPLAVNEDNLWGLKMLRSADNAADVKKIGLKLDNLEESLARSGLMG